MTLRVEVSIIPFGDESGKRIIHTLNISNIGQKMDMYEDEYLYVVEQDKYKELSEDDIRLIHKRGDGALELVRKAVERVLENDYF